MCMCVHAHKFAFIVFESLQHYGLYPTRFLCPWNSPGKNTGVDCHFLLLGIFPNQGLNLGLLHYRQILYQLSQLYHSCLENPIDRGAWWATVHGVAKSWT